MKHALNGRVAIRQANEDDLEAMEWDGEYIHFRRLYAEIFKASCQGKAVLWIAEIPEKTLIGQLFVQLASARHELADGSLRAYIYGFRIKPEYRNQGVGTRMLQVAEDDLQARGYECVTLNVARDNPDARRLYEQHGYQVVGSEPGRWSYIDHRGRRQNVHEPAWRMEKQLTESV